MSFFHQAPCITMAQKPAKISVGRCRKVDTRWKESAKATDINTTVLGTKPKLGILAWNCAFPGSQKGCGCIMNGGRSNLQKYGCRLVLNLRLMLANLLLCQGGPSCVSSVITSRCQTLFWYSKQQIDCIYGCLPRHARV